MKVYIYIDESGSIHKNSSTRYFAIGGYFAIENDKDKIKLRYKKINYNIKTNNNIARNIEIKSYNLSDNDKNNIFDNIKQVKSFCAICKVFDKHLMSKQVDKVNIFYNYGVKLLIDDCVLPSINTNEFIEFIISADNRNTGVNGLKDLENYLNTNYFMDNFTFKVTYYDSKTNYCIQLADLIVNSIYMYNKDKNATLNYIKSLLSCNYVVSMFPYNKTYSSKGVHLDI